jgi:sugar fermentation stimulation protein A
MLFPTPLIPGRLIKRYKRFLADVTLDTPDGKPGEMITATCPNTGSMMGLTAPGSRVWLSESDSPNRKYRHTWELIEVEELIDNDIGASPVMVGINTNVPNRVVAEAIADGKIPQLAGYLTLKREQRYGINSRIDILLECPKRGAAYVEIKNVHLCRTPRLAEFPDSVTERGAKHLDELSTMVAEGHRAVMVYLVQRGDNDRLRLAADIDPAYAAAFSRAKAAGVEAIALACAISATEITIAREIPVEA